MQALQSIAEEHGLSGLNQRKMYRFTGRSIYDILAKQYEVKQKETFTFTIRYITCIYKIDGVFKSDYGVD